MAKQIIEYKYKQTNIKRNYFFYEILLLLASIKLAIRQIQVLLDATMFPLQLLLLTEGHL